MVHTDITALYGGIWSQGIDFTLIHDGEDRVSAGWDTRHDVYGQVSNLLGQVRGSGTQVQKSWRPICEVLMKPVQVGQSQRVATPRLLTVQGSLSDCGVYVLLVLACSMNLPSCPVREQHTRGARTMVVPGTGDMNLYRQRLLVYLHRSFTRAEAADHACNDPPCSEPGRGLSMLVQALATSDMKIVQVGLHSSYVMHRAFCTRLLSKPFATSGKWR